MTFSSFLDLLFQNKTLNFSQSSVERSYKHFNTDFYINEVIKIQAWLKARNIKEGDHVCTLFENSIEWNICDAAIISMGAIHVSLSPTIDSNKIKAIIKSCDLKLILVGTPIIKELITLKLDSDELFTFNQILQESDKIELPKELFSKSKPNMMSALFFTSGTSSSTKAVYHTQGNILDNAKKTAEFYSFSSDTIALSILPIHYAFERMYNYVYQFSGASIHYANPQLSLLENILETQANVFCIVPKLLEELLHQSKNQETAFKEYIINKKPHIICSGAAIPNHLYELLERNNIDIYEMYGSTETLIVSANTPERYCRRSSGYILFPERVKIDAAGQLQVNIGNSHYHPNFGASEVLKLGWFQTKDIASIENEFLHLLGRESETFKNKDGLFLNSSEIEAELEASSLVKNIIIYYETNKGICAIFELTQLGNKLAVTELIKGYNSKRDYGKRINYYAISSSWTVESGEMTISFKVKRNFIIQKYKNELIAVN